jgi:hypothetical protein
MDTRVQRDARPAPAPGSDATIRLAAVVSVVAALVAVVLRTLTEVSEPALVVGVMVVAFVVSWHVTWRDEFTSS